MIQHKFAVSNSHGDYYRVADPMHHGPITIVHTAFGTFVCLTCRSHTCAHAKHMEKADDIPKDPKVKT